MATRYEVKEVQDRGRYWQVVYDATLDNGTVTEHGHSIPKETLEWRAAEYELDPATEFETILDIVLSEPYLAPEEQAGSLPGEELFDAPDIATARAKHINRCAKAKLRHRISTRKIPNGAAENKSSENGNPFDMIRTDAVIDPEVVALKREHVRRTREANAELRGKLQTEGSEDRAARVAQELGILFNAEQRKIIRKGLHP